MTQQETKFESWALVELFGHQKIVGKVTEATIGGCSFVRVDVPKCGKEPAYTKFYGNGAIYAMTPVSDEVGKALLERIRPDPISRFDLPELRSPASEARIVADDGYDDHPEDAQDDEDDDSEYDGSYVGRGGLSDDRRS
jgi:hypothetical protein